MPLDLISKQTSEFTRRKTMLVQPKDGKQNLNRSFEELFKSHRNFGLQALKELKRAERYCEFLSLVILDLASLAESRPKFLAKFSPLQRGGYLKELREFISSSVRETDLVSGFEENRLGLLLAETPQEGAKSLAKRLEEGIRFFLREKLQLTSPVPLPLKIVSYPDKLKGKEEIHATIQEFIDLG